MMVNCKNCGAPLSLDNAYCPHCGTANPEAQEHLKKLSKLDNDYKKTKSDVLIEVKKNKKGYGVLTIMILVLVFNLALIPLHNSSYRIANKIIASNQSVSQVKKQLNEYLDNRQYVEFEVYHDKYSASYRDYSEYSSIYYLISSFTRVKKQISNYFFGKELYTDALMRSCEYIKEFKDDYNRRLNGYKREEVDDKYFEQLNEDFDMFIKSYYKLTDEDIETIKDISESELLVLVSRRLNNEE